MDRKRISLTVLPLVAILSFARAGTSPSSMNSGAISVITPDFSQPQSGTLSITVTLSTVVDPSPKATNIIRYIIDGNSTYHTPLATTLTDTYRLDTTKLANGQHVLYINVTTYGSPLYGYYYPIGTYGPVSFSVNNGTLALQLRANYDELWLVPGQSVQLNPKLVYTDQSSSALTSTSVAFSTANSAAATVDVNGNVTAQGIGDTAVTITYNNLTQKTLVHVNDINVTPHFGNDGSLLTAYVPGLSTFLRDMFFGSPNPSHPQDLSDFKAAAINSIETGLYSPPSNTDYNSWLASMQQNHWSAVQTIVNDGFNVLFTADDMARGDDLLYNSTRGFGATMNPSPIVAAMNWAKNLGHTIGVEMVDEVSFTYGNNPKPQGEMSQPLGPQQIRCISDTCTVTWPNATINASWNFLITGATSNTALNRPITNPYHMSQTTSAGFTFASTGVGTQTFTALTDPGLTLQVFADLPQGDGTDYVHNDAFTVLMNTIHSADGNRPPISWPVAGDTWNAVSPWEGDPSMSDFATLYWSWLSQSYPWGSTLPEAQDTFDKNFAAKYPQVQRDRPILFESSGISQDFLPQSTNVAVTSMNNDTIVFASPHGVTVPASPSLSAVSPRFLLTGNSNAGLNGKYYVYAIPDAKTLKVYLASPTFPDLGWQFGGTITYPDGTSSSIYAMINGSIALTEGQCAAIANEAQGQIVTISGNPYGGEWYVKLGSICGPAMYVAQVPVGNGTGGTASIIYNNLPPIINDGGQASTLSADNITWAAAKGMAGVRVYGYSSAFDSSFSDNSIFPGDCTNVNICGIQSGVNPRYNGPIAAAKWSGMSNAFNLISQIEPYLLQPKLQSPDYGPHLVTAARTSSYGNMLMVINMAEGPDTELVDLSQYNPTGGTGTMYRMTAAALTQSSISGTSAQVTIAPNSLPSPPTVTSFSASPSSITAGNSTTLSWSVSGATSLSIDQGVGIQSSLTTGSVSVTPLATTTYTLTATNSAGTVTAQTAVFVTPAVDTIPPVASITSPISGATLSGTVSVLATASDNVGVVKVVFYLDGAIQATDTSLPYAWSWDTTRATNGSHVLSVAAFDPAGNLGQSPSVSVVVSNAGTAKPAITSALTASGIVGNPLSYQITASNAPTSFSASGIPGGVTLNSATGLVSGTPVAAGTANVTLGATNSAGTGSGALVITIASSASTGAPSTSITSPAPSASLSGTTLVTITATSSVGLVKVELYVDGNLAGTGGCWTTCTNQLNTPFPFVFGLDTTSLTNASHVLTTKAYDTAGNVGISSPVSVVVSNAN